MAHWNRTRRATTFGACASLLGGSSGQLALAQPRASALELEYDAPSECPTRSAVEDAALHLAGQSPRATVAASVSIERDGNIYRARVRTQAGARQRILEDASCSSVAEAIEVLLALAIDPEARVGSPAAAPYPPNSSAGGVPAQVTPADSRPPTRFNTGAQTPTYWYPQSVSPEPVSHHEPLILITPHLGVEHGALPHWAEVGGVSLAVLVSSRLKLIESGQAWRGTSQTLPGTHAGGAFSLWTLASGACLLTSRATPMTSACLGWEAGWLSGTSYGVRNNGTGGSPWLAPLAGFELGVPASHWVSLVLAAELAVPLVRRSFYLLDVGTARASQIHQPSSLSARLSFGLSLNL